MAAMIQRFFATRSAPGRPAARRGFSFVEILFAVMIMGMGFIMIAVIFPVGVQRTKANFDETQAAAMGRAAFDTLSQTARSTELPATGARFIDMPLAVTASVQRTGASSLVETGLLRVIDPRFSWVVTYQRDGISFWSPDVEYGDGRFVLFDDVPNQVTKIYQSNPVAGNVNKALSNATYWSFVVDVPNWDSSVTYNRSSITTRFVRDSANHELIYRSLGTNNTGHSYKDTGYWEPFAHPSKVAMLQILIMNRTTAITSASLAFNAGTNTKLLEPRRVTLNILDNDGSTNPMVMSKGINPIPSGSDANVANAFAAAPGSYVVVADDRITDTNGTKLSVTDLNGNPAVPALLAGDWNAIVGRLNGHIFRLGPEQATPGTFDLYPGYSLGDVSVTWLDGSVNPPKFRKVKVTKLVDADAFIVGKNRVSANGNEQDFDGYGQDVASYMGFVYLK